MLTQSKAIQSSGWRYFLLFIICNVTNAIFFWAFLPETKGVPLEEMSRLFRETSWFVPGHSRKYRTELAVTEVEIAEKRAAVHHEEVA